MKTLTEARMTKGATLNSLEGAMAYLNNRIESGLGVAVRAMFDGLHSSLSELYGLITNAPDDYLASYMDEAETELNYQRKRGLLKGMNTQMPGGVRIDP